MFDRIPNTFLVIPEAVVQICSVKKVLLKISQNSKENNRGRFWHNSFPVNLAKFLITPFLQNTSGGYFYSKMSNSISTK